MRSILFNVSLSELQQTLIHFNLSNVLPFSEQDKDQYLFLLMSHVVEPSLAQENCPIAIYDFPPSQAALAQINNGFADRFEIYFQGVELANGFHELTDLEIQRQRFAADNAQRQALNLPVSADDSYLLAALAHGLPPCSGVALGVDRLFALALGSNDLSTVMAFDFSRA